MSKQRRGNKTGNGSGFPASRFANVRLSAKETEHLQQLVSTDKLAVYQAFDLVIEGYKLSVNRDDNNATFVASLTDKATAERDHNIILTGRGSSPANAILSLLYKHYIATEGLWGDEYVSNEGISDFG